MYIIVKSSEPVVLISEDEDDPTVDYIYCIAELGEGMVDLDNPICTAYDEHDAIRIRDLLNGEDDMINPRVKTLCEPAKGATDGRTCFRHQDKAGRDS